MSLKYLPALAFLLVCHHTSQAAETISSQSNGLLSVEKDHKQNKIRMLRGQNGPMSLQDHSQRPLHEKVANQFAPEFGLRNPDSQLRLKHSNSMNGNTNIRYQQTHLGLPVIGGELVANLTANNELRSMSGEVSALQTNNVTPTISSLDATNMAMAAVSKWYQIANAHLAASPPELSIYDTSLLQDATPTTYLVWKIEVAPTYLAPINEYILIDAHNGGILLHYNKVDTLLARRTYTAGNSDNFNILPGTLVCEDPGPPPDPMCVNGANLGDQDSVDAHITAANVYDFYFMNHGRDSIDDNGMTIVSTTHFGNSATSGDPYENAFWAGDGFNQMVYGDGFASADDVVGHEITHGVTEFTSNLFYYSESGAINESLSDVWGELIDQNNNIGNDNNNVDWQLGEDLPPSIGVIRDMANPGAFGDPDRISSPQFHFGFEDNGGVHINSGVNNKAAYLMVDGGTFNSRTITGIGYEKVIDIYYEVQTNLLTRGSDYLDLYNALNQACTNLIGVGTSNIITTNDCDQVQLATEAVEMNLRPSATNVPTAEICPTGVNVYDLFFDDFELNNTNNWSVLNGTGSTSVWQTGATNISATTTGDYTLQANGYTSTGVPRINDSSIAYPNAIRIPASTATYIHFDHAFYFETGYDQSFVLRNYDGSLIEYTIDNGDTWIDASGLIQAGRNYSNTPLFSSESEFNNRSAYTRYSNGYVQTKLNLSTLAGNYVRFRFRSIADQTVESPPWSIDNFRVYLCADNAPPIPNAGPNQDVRADATVQLSGTATDPDGDTLTYSWTQTAGSTVTLSDANIANPTFTAPRNATGLQFTMSVTDTAGNTESDNTAVSVDIILTGTGDSGNGCSVGNNGRFDPIWMLLLSLFAFVHLLRRKKSDFNNLAANKTNDRFYRHWF